MDMEVLVGTIERITFQSDETGYTVARLKPELRLCHTSEPLATRLQNGLIPVIGSLANLCAGERIELRGHWTAHNQYGKQFKIVTYTPLRPISVEGITKYLGSGLIKGIGPAKARMIVEQFGDTTLDVIDTQPERLLEVKGVASKTAELIIQSWRDQKHIQEVMQFLIAHDVTPGYAVKIYKAYGNESIQKVTENPYRLASDIWGIGFKIADRIAMNLGTDRADPARISAGVRFVLTAGAEEGHVYLPKDLLEGQSAEALAVDQDKIPPAVLAMAQTGTVIVDNNRVYLPPYYYAEQGIARHLFRLSEHPRKTVDTVQIDALIHDLGVGRTEPYNAQQRQAIHATVTYGVSVLTGGPGTGKTTCVTGMLDLFKRLNWKVQLAAPTGRAAKRLSEVTGSVAKTIHRLLEFNPISFQFNRGTDLPIDTDVMILDEMSMVDTTLMNALLRALPSSARLILVGDADQLPSVGAGNVLRDIIGSRAIPVTHLTEIFRQAQESAIIMNAHRINRGESPELKTRKDGDFFFIEEQDPAKGLETIRDLCSRRLPERYGLDAIADIQVLSPMYRGEIGVDQINRELQHTLNPSGASLKRGDRELRIGDKVLQTRNNYDKLVFNGDIGRITHIDPELQQVRVTFAESVVYDYADLDEIVPAYAISVHKSQGSEYPAVVLPLYTTHYLMLQRNLLYTAITRAKLLVVIVGTRKALSIAVNNATVNNRYTGLRDALASKQTVEDSKFLDRTDL